MQNQKINMGRCVFCRACENVSNGQVQFSNNDHVLADTAKEERYEYGVVSCEL